MKNLTIFTVMLAYFLVVTLLSNSLGIIGWVLDHFFIFTIAVFSPFLGKKFVMMLLGLVTSTVSIELFLIRDMLQKLFTQTFQAINIPLLIKFDGIIFILFSITIFGSFCLSYCLDLLLVRILRIRERIGVVHI